MSSLNDAASSPVIGIMTYTLLPMMTGRMRSASALGAPAACGWALSRFICSIISARTFSIWAAVSFFQRSLRQARKFAL